MQPVSQSSGTGDWETSSFPSPFWPIPELKNGGQWHSIPFSTFVSKFWNVVPILKGPASDYFCVNITLNTTFERRKLCSCHSNWTLLLWVYDIFVSNLIFASPHRKHETSRHSTISCVGLNNIVKEDSHNKLSANPLQSFATRTLKSLFVASHHRLI